MRQLLPRTLQPPYRCYTDFSSLPAGYGYSPTPPSFHEKYSLDIPLAATCLPT